MIGWVLWVLEAAALIAAIVVVGHFTRSGADRTTPLMVFVVTVAWIAYRVDLQLWLRKHPWIAADRQPEAPVPPELKAAVERVEAARVEFNGRVWRTGSAASEVGADGAAVALLRPPALLSTGQAVLVSLGLIGTFLGLTLGLTQALPNLTQHGETAPNVASSGETSESAVAAAPFEPAAASKDDAVIDKMQKGMGNLLGGAQLAFAKSLAGVTFAMLWVLRLRYVESRRDKYLDALAEELDARLPLLAQQHLHVHMATEIVKTNSLLDKIAAGAAAERERSEARAGELKATVEQIGKTVAERAGELVETMQGLSESLPAAIGVRPGQSLLELLAPQFARLVDEMKKLTDSGNEQITKAMLERADGEVSGLKRALSDVVATLDRLPSDYRAHMGEVQAGVRNAMGAMEQAVTFATTDLNRVSDDLRAIIAEIGRILPEVKTVASTLRGAGEEVRVGLDGVASPLLGLPSVLDATRAGLASATSALRASESALVQHAESARALNDALGAQKRVTDGATEQARLLVQQVDSLRTALESSERRLGELSAAQALATGEAVAELGKSLSKFTGGLEGVQRSAEGVSLEAAQRVADALGRGATEFERAMQRLTEHSQAMEASLEAARETADALSAYATSLRDGVNEVARPLGPVAAALKTVPGSVQEAAQALQSEHAALQGLGAQLREQAAVVKAEQEALGARIEQYRQLNALLAREMAAHLDGIAAANEQVRAAWAEATGKSREVVEHTARQLGDYAQKVEQALRLPGDLRRLDQTIGDLSDVLDALKDVLAERPSDLVPDDADA